MLRRFGIAFTIVATLSGVVGAGADPDVRMPPGTRKDDSGGLVSGRGLRDTTDFIAKELARRGIAVAQIGPARIRGVELTRFVSQQPSTPWLAIHVLRAAGKTLIFFVPRPGS
jgi:hypothetical protein